MPQAREVKLQAKRDCGTGAASNRSSEHFNIISLQYHNTQEGGRLREHVGGGCST
jgi:hypothetical protein